MYCYNRDWLVYHTSTSLIDPLYLYNSVIYFIIQEQVSSSGGRGGVGAYQSERCHSTTETGPIMAYNDQKAEGCTDQKNSSAWQEDESSCGHWGRREIIWQSANTKVWFQNSIDPHRCPSQKFPVGVDVLKTKFVVFAVFLEIGT